MRGEGGCEVIPLGRAKEKNEDILFSSGMWPLLSNLEDPELRGLAQALPATVLKSIGQTALQRSILVHIGDGRSGLMHYKGCQVFL